MENQPLKALLISHVIFIYYHTHIASDIHGEIWAEHSAAHESELSKLSIFTITEDPMDR